MKELAYLLVLLKTAILFSFLFIIVLAAIEVKEHGLKIVIERVWEGPKTEG